MADLQFLAAGVTDAPQWTRAESSNPMVAILRDSWKNRTKTGRGKQERTIGAAKALTVSSSDSWKTARSGILSAARALDLGVEIAYFGQRPVVGEDDETGEPILGDAPKLPTIKDEESFPGGNVEMRFRAKPARQVIEKPGPEDAATGEDDDEETDEDA